MQPIRPPRAQTLGNAPLDVTRNQLLRPPHASQRVASTIRCDYVSVLPTPHTVVTFALSPLSPHRLQLHLRSFASFLVIACVSLSWGAAAAFAGTYHITPEGAGERDGRDWANAQPWSTVPAIIRQLKPGDSILLASGTYELTQPIDLIGRGQPDAPITFAGIDTGDGPPELFGHHTVTDALPEKSSVGLRFPGEAHHWTVSNSPPSERTRPREPT
jgi:hypothetical protein